uniref:F-box domain-containing protein n=1 Tax=Knipowitschia caucasica TaxID=637954 RepID=A0AAV2LFK4_KNICA
MKSHYLCRLLLCCDNDLLRALANLTHVLLVRQKRGLLTFEGCNNNNTLDEPAIMVVPGSSKSYSGISLYKDFISALPVNLAKRILSFLDESCLTICCEVSHQWHLLAKETLTETEFRKRVNKKIAMLIKRKPTANSSPTYANIIKVQVLVSADGSGAKEEHKLVEMEERNIYCGGFFTKDIIDKHDCHRVIDHNGNKLMAVSSKNGMVQLLYVSATPKVISVLKESVVQIRALRLCEDKDMVIAGCVDAIIRCWNLTSQSCVMVLSGHAAAVNCLDVCGDTLVSGARDCTQYNFRHKGTVECVKIQTRVYSGCNKGQVKVWDLETAAEIKVISGHLCSVRCLFLDEWHLLTGDVKGVVKAWSSHCDASVDCIRTFKHPKEVTSLTLSYLRVVTACMDGKIRIFNFLTGDCIKVIVAVNSPNVLLSVHFHHNSFVVNTALNVKSFLFGEVVWDYEDKKQVQNKDGLISNIPKLPASAPVKNLSSSNEKALRRKALSCLTSATEIGLTEEQRDSIKVALSEKATSARIKRRGPHHPLNTDCIMLKLNAAQKARTTDEAAINMELNARLRDDWSAPPVTPAPLPKTAAMSPKSPPKREVSTAPGRIMRPQPPLGKRPSLSTKTQQLQRNCSK